MVIRCGCVPILVQYEPMERMDNTPNARRSTLGSFSNVPRPFLVGGAYAWNNPHQLEIQLHYVNWMSAVNLVFDFQDDQMHVDFQVNFDSPTKIMRKKLTPLP